MAAGCCDDGAPWDAEVACDGLGPAPPPAVLAWAGTYTGHVTLYLCNQEPFEGTGAAESGDLQRTLVCETHTGRRG